MLLCGVIDPVTLTFEPQNITTFRVSQGHSLHQVWTLWDHSFLSYVADRQTNRRTDLKILPTPTDIVGVGNEGDDVLATGDCFLMNLSASSSSSCFARSSWSFVASALTRTSKPSSPAALTMSISWALASFWLFLSPFSYNYTHTLQVGPTKMISSFIFACNSWTQQWNSMIFGTYKLSKTTSCAMQILS